MDFKERDALEGYGEFHAHEVPTVEEPEHIVNLRVMNAAQDLLAACYAVIDTMDTMSWCGPSDKAADMVRAAIAKAEGQ